MKKLIGTYIVLGILLSACASAPAEPAVLRIATTTSVDNSGLLTAILLEFEAQYNVTVEVVAVGTGQALAIGEAGDADLVLVHAPSLEIPFVDNGYGTQRYSLMYNDFIIVGPADDPAGIAGLTSVTDAVLAIADSESTFVSRGDNSGTHTLELSLWASAGFTPDENMAWYLSIGQGMGAALNFANEENAYLVTDRGTYLAQSVNLPNLVVLFGGESVLENPDELLHNFYSAIPVNPELHSNVDYELAMQFVDWITSVPVQTEIQNFRADEFGQSLFYPNSDAWHSQNGIYDGSLSSLKVQ